ncbi:MAG: hypothetical protein ACR652_18045 [Methylocystis sp.]|uniref:hypothetical protein n=1 Tax=Methylocystis sp. TaxID=1911079 RepID=UPI003DA5A194
MIEVIGQPLRNLYLLVASYGTPADAPAGIAWSGLAQDELRGEAGHAKLSLTKGDIVVRIGNPAHDLAGCSARRRQTEWGSSSARPTRGLFRQLESGRYRLI